MGRAGGRSENILNSGTWLPFPLRGWLFSPGESLQLQCPPVIPSPRLPTQAAVPAVAMLPSGPHLAISLPVLTPGAMIPKSSECTMGSEDRNLLRMPSPHILKERLLSQVPSADTTRVSSNMGTATQVWAAPTVGQAQFSAGIGSVPLSAAM